MFFYNDYASWSERTFGHRVQKIALDAGFSCPNRDGSKGRGGCVFCDNASFNPPYCSSGKSIRQQLEEGKRFFAHKGIQGHYLAYFQAFSNTYAPLERLKVLYGEALDVEGVEGLVIATRPDCVDEEKLDYLELLSRQTHVEVEYGLESVLDRTLALVNRCHTQECSRRALTATRQRGITTGAHVILGLPGESREDMLGQAGTVSTLDVDILKIHQLQVIRGTRLASLYEQQPFPLFDAEGYVRLVAQYLRLLRPDIVIERLVSTSPGSHLLAPCWGLKANEVVRRLQAYMNGNGYRQGDCYLNCE